MRNYICLIVLPMLLITGCQTGKMGQYGIQEGHEAFVPAQIAVLPCLHWPPSAAYKNRTLSNIAEAASQNLCKHFDTFVIESFKNQPYMHGFSPRAIQKSLVSNQLADHLDQVFTAWTHSEDNCHECQDAVAFYRESIAWRPKWHDWLHKLSRASAFSDSTLIPLVLYGVEKRAIIRDQAIAHREIGIALFLVDTNNGKLLWAGHRSAALTHQSENLPKKEVKPDFPDWKALYPRLFIEALWKEFPGRIIH